MGAILGNKAKKMLTQMYVIRYKKCKTINVDSYVEVSLTFKMEGLGEKHFFLSVQII